MSHPFEIAALTNVDTRDSAPVDPTVSTLKNTVDMVLTEWGVAELRGRSLRQRAAALIAIAHPDHRDRLRAEAADVGYL